MPLERTAAASLPNIKNVFCLKNGNIEDYYPLDIVADVINRELSPTKQITAADFDASKSGKERLDDFKRVMFAHGSGDSIRYLKKSLGGLGTRLMKEQSISLNPELVEIFTTVKRIADPENVRNTG